MLFFQMNQDTPSSMNEAKRQTIYEINTAFPFSQMDWHPPTSVLGEHNNFIIRPFISEKGGENAPIYIQTPACLIKGGGFNKVGRHYGLELIFSGEDFLQWVEKLEDLCQKKLLEKQSDWFQTELTEEDISNLFIAPYKMVKGKGGRQYSLKTNVPLDKKVKIFDENQKEISYEYHDDSFHTDSQVIGIMELSGIKCSPRNFHVGFEIKQMLLIKENPLFETCLIQAPKKTEKATPPSLEKNVAAQAVVEGEGEGEVSRETDKPVEPLRIEKMNIEEWTTDDVVAVAEDADSRGEAESKTKPIRKTLEKTKESEEFVHIKSPRELALEKIKKARDLGIFKQLEKRNIRNLDMELLSQKFP